MTGERVVTMTIHEHAVVSTGGLVIQRCGIPHSEPYDWEECPVAGRWTLMRTPT